MQAPSTVSRESSRMRGVATLALMMALVTTLLVAGSLQAKKNKFEEKPLKGQTGRAFVNDTGETVHGLTVQLSKDASVITHGDTHRAGPFFDVEGNGTKKITLSNPDAPIEPGSDSIDLVFRSYKSGLKITKYWWLDAKGKQVGKKKSP